jgi:hypothetical protein
MTLVWLERPSQQARQHQKLFKHLALGNSIRGARLPIQLTQPTASLFMQAPDHLTVEQALRWSQIRGMGADASLAAAVVATRLGATFEHESYWEAVLRLLIRQPKLDLGLVPPIIDFMHTSRDAYLRRPLRDVPGRSFGSLVHGVRKWMDRSPSYRLRPKLHWPGTPINGFRYIEPQKNTWSVRCWTIRELLDSQELIEEGQVLHHCVARYAERCARRETSIWSMRCHGSLESHRVLTIQLVPATRTIVRALGSCNRPPKRDARQMLHMWAKREGLGIAKWV